MRYFIPLFLIMIAFPHNTLAQLVVIYPNVNGIGKELFGYSALKLALQNSGVDYELHVSKIKVNDQRIRRMIADREVSISDFGTSTEAEQEFLPIYFPIDLGLNGWRIFAIHKDNQSRFTNITTIEALRAMTAGQGLGWSDVKILEHAGLTVFEGSHISNLFAMTEFKRFDYFPLSANATHRLLDIYQKKIPNVVVESNILLIYPFGRLFFVHKDNRALHDAVKTGLAKAFESGEYWRLFKAHKSNQGLFTKANLKSRTQIFIENPHMTKEFKGIPKKYFFNLNMLD